VRAASIRAAASFSRPSGATAAGVRWPGAETAQKSQPFANVEVLVAVDILASSGVFDAAAEQAVCRSILYAVDGGWGIAGQAFTNDVLDEGPE
jgi:hypothetical protein